MSTLPSEDFVTNLLPTVASCVVDVSWRVFCGGALLSSDSFFRR
jgi:hypothetical protein